MFPINYPSLSEFLAAPVDRVRGIAPATLILGAGGTRRRAVLEGIQPQSHAYAQWTRHQMIRCLDLIFRHGVQHIFAAVLTDSHARELTPGYSDKLLDWTQYGLAGDDALPDYASFDWRVRLVGTESWPDLQETADRLRRETAQHTGPIVWFTVNSDVDAHWRLILETAAAHSIWTRAELIRAIYGEEVPLATLYLGTGKPQIVESIVPPLLMGKVECYWRQHLGYDLDERTLREILYDYAYVRPTWREDKTGRAEQVLAYADVWATPTVLGLGTRIGPFWYPAPTPSPDPTPGEPKH
jgi:hypothetical protein